MMQLYDHDTEVQVIAQILQFGEIPQESETITMRLKPQAFTSKPYRQIYSAILELDANGERIDAYQVTNKCNGDLTLTEVLLTSDNFDGNTTAYESRVQRLIDLYKARQATTVADHLKSIDTNALSGTRQIIATAIKDLESIETGNDDALKSTQQSVLDWYQEIVLPQETNEATGVHTGFKLLDNIGGLRPQTLTVIGAYQANGKTALAMQIALNASKAGVPVGYFSLEMSGAELMNRNIANLSGFNGNVISTRWNDLTQDDRDKINRASEDLKTRPLYTDDTATSDIVHICTIIRTAKRRFGLRVAFVDYLQIIDALGERATTEENNLARICRTLKNLAKRENIAIVLLSQISRNSGTFEPKMTHLRGSGQIAESADNVVLMYTPSKVDDTATYYGKYENVSTRGTSQLNLAKCRNGNVGLCIIAFDSNTMRLNDLDVYPQREQTPDEANGDWL